MLSAVRILVGSFPVSFGVGGRLDRLAIKALDPLFSRTGTVRIKTPLGAIELDMRHRPQRFMAYCYYNLKRHYARSPLGRHIRSFSREPLLSTWAQILASIRLSPKKLG